MNCDHDGIKFETSVTKQTLCSKCGQRLTWSTETNKFEEAVTDFRESLRQEAEKSVLAVEWKGDDYGARKRYYFDLFLAGTQAALNILGRSATSEEHPPHFWAVADLQSNRIIANWKRWVSYDWLPVEYCAVSEMQALRAADLLEIDHWKRLEARLRDCAATELSQEREARKGDSAEISLLRQDMEATRREAKIFREAAEGRVARLTAALEEIANRDDLPWQPHALHCIAREALGEAGN